MNAPVTVESYKGFIPECADQLDVSKRQEFTESEQKWNQDWDQYDQRLVCKLTEETAQPVQYQQTARNRGTLLKAP